MTAGTIISLAITWFSIGPPSFTNEYSPTVKAHGIAEAAWGNTDTPDLPTIDRVYSRCSKPKMILLPPRPGDPLQSQLVTRLTGDLGPLDITIIDGERLQADQERDADLVYAETSDAAAASRVLLAQRGDFEVSWRLEVAIEGPQELYGLETWEARGELHLAIVNLLTGEELEGASVVATARQQTREEALDRAIQSVSEEAADSISGPVLRSWYGFAIGTGAVVVDAAGSGDSLRALIPELQQLEGVNSVHQTAFGDSAQLLVRGWHTAGELAAQLGSGRAVTCHHLELSTGDGRWWIAIPVAAGVLVAICLIVGRRRAPPGVDLKTA